MTAEEYLKGLDAENSVFNLEVDCEYTEKQLLNFAEAYHKAKVESINGEFIDEIWQEANLEIRRNKFREIFKQKLLNN